MSEAVGVKVQEQFSTEAQQRHAAKLGMWAWLVTELLLFGGLLLSALVLRILHPASVAAAAQAFKLWIGAVNSVILIASSFTMSAAVACSRLGRPRPMVAALLATAAFGILFLMLKSYEYYTDYSEHLTPFLSRPYKLAGDAASMLFVNLYWVTTVLHFFHLTVGVAVMLVMAWLGSRPRFLQRHQNRVEIAALYWDFIDLVWIIVFPTLYGEPVKLDPELGRQLRVPAFVSVALLSLLGLNVLLALTRPFVGFGYVGIGIAAVMVAIVLLFTMDVREESGLIRLFAVLGFFWLAIMFGLTAIDYVSR